MVTEIIKPIKIISGSYNLFTQFRSPSTKVISIHFNYESKIQKKLQMKDQQCYMSVSLAYSKYLSSY